MARVTGLEPATSGVTGRRSNQLSYTRFQSVEAANYASRRTLSTACISSCVDISPATTALLR